MTGEVDEAGDDVEDRVVADFTNGSVVLKVGEGVVRPRAVGGGDEVPAGGGRRGLSNRGLGDSGAAQRSQDGHRHSTFEG